MFGRIHKPNMIPRSHATLLQKHGFINPTEFFFRDRSDRMRWSSCMNPTFVTLKFQWEPTFPINLRPPFSRCRMKSSIWPNKASIKKQIRQWPLKLVNENVDCEKVNHINNLNELVSKIFEDKRSLDEWRHNIVGVYDNRFDKSKESAETYQIGERGWWH